MGPFYDIIEWPTEKLVLARGREKLFEKVAPGTLLELGVGTGKNIPYYPSTVEATALDISQGMLRRACRKAQQLRKKVKFELADLHQLPFEDATFDTVVGALVLCTVADPALALKETKRVLKPTGKLILLEHGRPRAPRLAVLFDLLTPFTNLFWGDHLNRDMGLLLEQAGFVIEEVNDLARDVWKLIVAGPNSLGK